MNLPRAVIFDVYRTLLEVEERSAEEQRVGWERLHGEFFGRAPEMTLEHLAERCRHVVSEDHAIAHAVGVPHAEVVWKDVMRRALPALSTVADDPCEEFLFQHIQLLRSLRLAPQAPALLRDCHRRGILLGIVSNAQPYTLRELTELLAPSGLSLDVFEKDLSLWSFENGFSKPDPHVFRLLTFRLERRGLRPGDTLLVGDRLDNDIEPSRAQGFQTWWLNESAEGDWTALIRARFPQRESQQTP